MNHMGWAAICLGIVVGTAAAKIEAQQPESRGDHGTISGTVLAADVSSPLPLAIVSLVRVDATTSGPAATLEIPGNAETLVTGDDGSYRFTQVKPASYRVHIRRIGYRPSAVDVELRRPTDVSVSIALEVAPVRLLPIEVHATSLDLYGRGNGVDGRDGNGRVEIEHWRQRSFLTSDVRALTHEDVLEAVTVGAADPFRALQRLPGVTTRDNWTAEVWTRGAAWDHTRVYFDGLPLFNPLHAGGVTTAINEDVLGSVVFHPGVRSVSHGEGAAGVIDFTSRPAGGTGDLRGFGTVSLFAQGVTMERRFLDGRLGAVVGGRASLSSTDILNDLPRDYADVAGRADVDLGNDRYLELSGIWERDWIRESLSDGPTDNTAGWGNSAARVTYHMPVPGAYSKHSIGVSQFDQVVRRTEPGLFIEQFDESKPTQADTDSRIRHVTVAGEFGSLIPDETETGWRAGYQVTYHSLSYDGPPPAPYPIQTFASRPVLKEKLTVASLWGETRWKPATRLSLQGGIRVQASGPISGQGRIRLAPQLSGRYAVTERLFLTAGVGRSYQHLQALAPAGLLVGPGLPTSHYWLLAGDSTPAIRSDVATLGAEHWLGYDWLASVNLYARRSSGIALVDPTPGPIPGTPNIVEGTNVARGVETSVRRLAGSFTWSIGYTLGFSDMEAAGLRFPSAADRRHAFDFTSIWRTPLRLFGGSFTFAQGYTFASGAPYTRVHPGNFTCDEEQDRCVPIVPDVLDQPNAVRSEWHLGLDQRLDWDWEFAAWKLGLFFYQRVGLSYSNDLTYTLRRGGGCSRESIDSPFCGPESDQFEPDMTINSLQLGLRVAF
ncbi:MAG: TonB-dependent receptor [Gemmatimonadota bacterium]|nr:MAG: TonB-dependent receptor [Gemmatimonadota bacterium]